MNFTYPVAGTSCFEDAGGAIKAVGTSRHNYGHLDKFPRNLDKGAIQYIAGSFEYCAQEDAVPVPAR